MRQRLPAIHSVGYGRPRTSPDDRPVKAGANRPPHLLALAGSGNEIVVRCKPEQGLDDPILGDQRYEERRALRGQHALGGEAAHVQECDVLRAEVASAEGPGHDRIEIKHEILADAVDLAVIGIDPAVVIAVEEVGGRRWQPRGCRGGSLRD